ncbi:MAG: glucosamine-6-phosphate deaminase, partial [Erysipelotrichaceae bacterium]|nr:glucosamine-6-phosphate deaminase [Erysipelotrichaceae bacterium]
ENIHIPDGDAEDPLAECERYEASLQDVTIDLQILGLGTDGHIGFNEPGTPFESLTHVAELTEQTRRDNAHYFGGNIELVPKKAISMGLATVMRARRVVVIATGTAKANAVYNMIKGPMKSRCPASVLQAPPRLTVIADKEAAQRILF